MSFVPKAARIHDATDVAAWRMCVGCGACVPACSEHKLDLINLLNDGLRPSKRPEASACGSCRDCLDVCPGVGISHGPPEVAGGPRRPEPTGGSASPGAESPIAELMQSWGPVLEVWEGFASDPEIRRSGSSGGLASALALFGIEHAGMHGLLHVTADPADRHLNRASLSRSRAEILEATGSRYAPAAPCEQLALVEQAPGRCAFIGKPCDVQALRKSQAVHPSLDEKIGIAISIFCAGTPSTQGTIDLLRLHGIDPEQVDELRYRGRGWPGSFAARMRGSDEWQHLATYAQAWGFLQKYRPYRCHVCPDGTGEFADISCGDPWYREIPQDEPGRSLVLVRTQKGRELVRAAIAAGQVDLQPVDPSVLFLSQKELQYKRGAIWGRLLTMRALGVPAPRFTGFSLLRNWLRIPLSHKLRAFSGTAKRVITRGYRRPAATA